MAKPVNSLPGGVNDFGASDLARIGEQYNRVPQEQRNLRRRYNDAHMNYRKANELPGGEFGPPLDPADLEAMAGIKAWLAIAPEDHPERADALERGDRLWNGTAHDPGWERIINESRKTIETLQPRMRIYHEALAQRIQGQTSNTINREFSESRINSHVSQNINNQAVQVAGLGLASQMPYEQLAERRKEVMQRVAAVRAHSLSEAGRLVTNEGFNQDSASALQENTGKVRNLADELVPIMAAMKTQRALGQDPESRNRRVTAMGQKAQEFLSFEHLRNDVQNGTGEFGSLSPAEMKKKETEAAEALVKALDELRNAAGKSKEEIAKLSKNAEEAADNFKEVQDAQRAGAGQGGNGGGMQLMTGAAGLARIVGQGIQVMGINQPMARMANIGGYANIENRKHDGWRAALAGDMQERINLGGWATAHEFGANRANYAGAKLIADGAGAVVGGLAGGAQVLDAVTNAPQGKILGSAQTAANVTSGSLAIGESAMLGLVTANDAIDKISTSQAEIAGINQADSVKRQLTHVSGYQLQRYRDHAMGLMPAAFHMGNRGDAFLNAAGGTDFLTGMHDFGLSSEEAGSLAAAGAAGGSMFSANQVLQAKRFENLGFGTAGENMQRMTALSAGSQNPSQSLERILGNAVTIGLESSKAIGIIADATSSVAEQNAQRGVVGSADAISQVLMSAIDPSVANKEVAAQRAVSAFAVGERGRTNTAASFHGMLSVSRLQKELGVDWGTGMMLGNMSPTAMRAMLSGAADDNELRQMLIKQGIDPNKGAFAANPRAALRTAINTKTESGVLQGAGLAEGTLGGFQQIRAAIESNPAYRQAFEQGIIPEELGGLVAQTNWAMSLGNPGVQPFALLQDALASAQVINIDSSAVAHGRLGDGTGPGAAGRRELTRGARQDTEAAKAGTKILGQGETGADYFQLLDLSGQRANQAAAGGGASAESHWTASAARAAESFNKSVTDFSNASGTLLDAANKLLALSGASGIAGTKPEPPPDNKDGKRGG